MKRTRRRKTAKKLRKTRSTRKRKQKLIRGGLTEEEAENYFKNLESIDLNIQKQLLDHYSNVILVLYKEAPDVVINNDYRGTYRPSLNDHIEKDIPDILKFYIPKPVVGLQRSEEFRNLNDFERTPETVHKQPETVYKQPAERLQEIISSHDYKKNPENNKEIINILHGLNSHALRILYTYKPNAVTENTIAAGPQNHRYI